VQILDRNRQPLDVGDRVRLRSIGPHGPQELTGTIKALYDRPEAVTLTLDEPTNVYDAQLGGLIRREKGEDLYVTLRGRVHGDGAFVCLEHNDHYGGLLFAEKL